MAKYSHVFSIAFTVESDLEDGADVTQGVLIAACLKRMADLTENDEWIEAAGAPTDTYEIEPLSPAQIHRGRGGIE